MGETLMEMGPEQLEVVGQYVRSHIHEWMGEPDMVLRERIVRVEESIKNQLELMRLGFEQTEKRFEHLEKRFEQVDKRFERVDKRFDRMFALVSGLFITLIGGFITVIVQLI